ncbi:MAG: DUF115 domain-containing protein [Nannocystis sp.]|nr:DUF115 domain-containing protein [Nannocystis sp.]
MNTEAIKQQSNAAYKQWAEQWRAHAREHSKFKQPTFEKFENIGVGRAVLCVANGYSFEEEIETIKLHQDKVDIMACDKTLGNLIDNGVTPTYCMVCDANVDAEKYLEKWKDKLSGTTLFINVCANPEWTKRGNWKEVVFFSNRDVIDSHLEFAKLSGCPNFIPAGTNVSNAMVILLTQSDNEGRQNVFGYDKILLIGFDYSWRFDGKYYAFDEDAGGKANYMRHVYTVTPNGNFCYTSGNLTFSMDWLKTYINAFKLPVVQCSADSLLALGGKAAKLSEQMQYSFKPEDRGPVKSAVKELREIKKRELELLTKINSIGRDHYWASYRSF